jgi:hypothetical protein
MIFGIVLMNQELNRLRQHVPLMSDEELLKMVNIETVAYKGRNGRTKNEEIGWQKNANRVDSGC